MATFVVCFIDNWLFFFLFYLHCSSFTGCAGLFCRAAKKLSDILFSNRFLHVFFAFIFHVFSNFISYSKRMEILFYSIINSFVHIQFCRLLSRGKKIDTFLFFISFTHIFIFSWIFWPFLYSTFNKRRLETWSCVCGYCACVLCFLLLWNILINNYSMSPSWIWSDKITTYNHFISNKGEWNNCFS